MKGDPFATLGIDRAFEVDLAALEKRHRELSRALHPDKFASSGPAERQMALGKAVEVNEAWRTVRDPIKRAEALFALAEIPVGERAEPKPTPMFLMDMLEQREALEEAKTARNAAKVESLAAGIRARVTGAEKALAEGFAKGADASLVAKLGELRFYKRFLEEVSAIQDEMHDGAA